MTFDEILRDLLDPGSHPGSAGAPVLVQTHASAVVLAGDDVYKLKKPVDFGFLDYSTLARRKAMCEAEVALNRRLAPGVYLGVVPITQRAGHAVLGGEGSPIEYAVHMRRLPEDATLAAHVRSGPIASEVLSELGRTVARFHADARRGPDVSAWGEFEPVRQNCEDNFAGLAPHAGSVAPVEELLRLELATRSELDAQRELIERRARANVPCETHGDLRLEHVYLIASEDRVSASMGTHGLVIVDCIEFSPRFSCADPVADIAFLAMDLRAHGAWPEARALLDAYFDESHDHEGRALVPLYVAYRSAVRAKVRAMQASAPGIPAAQRAEALQLARAHVQLAVGELALPRERPCLVLVGGLPGTGKSVLSGGLAASGAFTWLRADAIRKELAGLDPLTSGRADVRAGIYTPEWNDRTYGECLVRAREHLFAGRRVLVDASFKEERRRLAFVDAARDWGVPVVFLECTARPELIRARLAGRVGDPSDADWSIYEHVRRTWEPLGPRTRRVHTEVDTSDTREESLARALVSLGRAGL
jgi:aminoglycoside phosphotransferase family enzyme/predicted kinase